jgi:integrase
LYEKELEATKGTNPGQEKSLLTRFLTFRVMEVFMARTPVSLLRTFSHSTRKTVYYIRIWLPVERRYATARSAAVLADKLGIDPKEWPPSSKAGARHIGEAWLAAGGGVSRMNDPLLGEYLLDFWTWEKSDYIKGKLERGQAIGKQHCGNSLCHIETHVIGRIQGIHLRDVTANTLDRLQLQLKRETKLSPKTVNLIMASVNTPIREAFRLGKIFQNPARNFRGLANDSKIRGILSTVEMEKLLDTPWENESYRLAVTIAYFTGARLGEVLALSPKDIELDFEHKPVVWIRKSWSLVVGMKGTKTGNIRVVPISEDLRDDLLRLADNNPHKNDFIFWGPEPDKPLSEKLIESGFMRQLKNIGINETIRRVRNVSFHSLRHMFNSSMRGTIPDETLRLATGHADPGMSDHYDHLTDERLAEIRKAQESKILCFKGA